MAEKAHSMIGCDDARELLWPMDRPREYVEGEEEARLHLERCARCQAFFQRDAAITRALRRTGIQVSAPQDLRERVFDALARERALGSPPRPTSSTPARLSRWLPLGAAATVALLIGIGLSRPRAEGGGRSGAGDGAEEAYVQDFLSRAVEADVVEFPEPQAVTAFFMRELGVRVEPIALETGRVSRAMICLIEGERAAMVEYEIGGRTIAHYLLPTPRAEVGRPSDVRSASEAGVQVVSWSDERFEHALVSDLSEDDLTALARSQFATR